MPLIWMLSIEYIFFHFRQALNEVGCPYMPSNC